MAAAAEHVELSDTHLIIGLVIAWRNRSDEPIPVKEIQVWIQLHRLSKEPLRLYPLERFMRLPGQRSLQKNPVRPFTLPPGEVYTEQIRFISQEVLNLEPGPYAIEIRLTDTRDRTEAEQITIHVPSKIKYRRSEEWQQDEEP